MDETVKVLEEEHGAKCRCAPCKKTRSRALRLARFFNISLDDYASILAGQGGVCAVCHRPPKDGKSLAVDHCHKTGLIRGALCSFCNRAIGVFRDDLERFERTAAYLRAPPATAALGAPRYGIKGRTSNKIKTIRRLNPELFPPKPSRKTTR